jgi:hypothetical protein
MARAYQESLSKDRFAGTIPFITEGHFPMLTLPIPLPHKRAIISALGRICPAKRSAGQA